MGKRRTRHVYLVAASLCTVSASASADPLRLRADAFAEARAPAGLLVLQGQDKIRPWIDAEAMVWTGATGVAGSSETRMELVGVVETILQLISRYPATLCMLLLAAVTWALSLPTGTKHHSQSHW